MSRNRPPGCKAYERGDQWFCDACQLVWDINDDEPPVCEPVRVGIDFGRDDKTDKEVEVIGIEWGSDKCKSFKVGMEALENIRRSFLRGDNDDK